LRLASIAVLENLKVEIQELLDELNDIFMATRYPDEFLEIEEKITKEKCLDLLEKTKETFKWLEKK
jgi:HEPN domain-containing protein